MKRRERLPGPYLYDDIDKPNIYPVAPAAPKIDWRIFGVLGVVSIISLFIFIWIVTVIYSHLDQIRILSSGLPAALANFVIWFLYFVPVIIIITLLYHSNRYLSVLTKRAQLINVMEYQTTLSQLNVSNIIDKFVPIMLKRAEQSKFAGVQTLTYDDSKTVTNQETLEQLLNEPLDEDMDVLPPGNDPILNVLLNQGLINRSNNSILIGFGEK